MDTIKNIANRCGVSKVAVDNCIKRLDLKDQLQKQGNRLLVPQDVEKQILDYFSHKHNQANNRPPQQKKTATGENIGLYEVLVQQLETLQEQLKVKDSQIAELTESNRKLIEQTAELTTALRGQQQLHHESNLIANAEPTADQEEPQPTIKRKHWWQR